MTEAQVRKRQVANCEEDIDAKLRNTKNTVEQAGSLSLYSFMNDIGINRIRDRVNPSNSIALSKSQRTKMNMAQSNKTTIELKRKMTIHYRELSSDNLLAKPSAQTQSQLKSPSKKRR